MRRYWCLVLLFCLSFSVEAGVTQKMAIKWPSGQVLKIENGHFFYEGLRHEPHSVTATQCHRKVLAQAQRVLLSPRAFCQSGAKGQVFTLIVNGKSERSEVCLVGEPKYQRTLERAISCSK